MKIKVVSDYVCPFCYIQKEVIRQLQEKYDLEVEMLPFELRRPPIPKVDPMNDEMRLKRFHEVISPEATRLGVEMKLPWMSPHPYTTNTFLGYLFALQCGQAEQYNQHVYHSFYVEEKDISDITWIESILKSLSLDLNEFHKQIPDFQKQLEENYKNKAKLSNEGIPAILVNGKTFSGYHNVEQLEKILHDEYIEQAQGMTCGINGCE